MLVLQLADQAKAVAVDLAVFRAPPGAIGGREQPLLDVEIDRAGGDAGVVAEGFEVKLSHPINITVHALLSIYFNANYGFLRLMSCPDRHVGQRRIR